MSSESELRRLEAAAPRIIVVIPAFDEVGSVGRVVGGLIARGIPRVRVVDNGSSDGTGDVARAAGAEVVAEPRRGYGQACFTGCRDLPEDCEWILFCDADGSDDLDSIPRLIERAGEFDFVLGNRRASEAGRRHMTAVQNFGNWLATFLLRVLFGAAFHDLGPMRLIRRSIYEALEMKDRGFGWTVEMQARAAQLGVRSTEVPVPYHQRSAGQSKVSGTISGSVQAGVIILSAIGRFAVDVWQRPLTGIAALLLVAGAALMMPFGNFREAAVVPWFLAGAGVMSLGFVVSWAVRSVGPVVFFGVAVAARMILLPMEPGADVWRYVWEGMVQNAGANPYTLAPDSAALAGLRADWWPKINHASVTAVYPPLAELVFRGLAWISPTAVFFKLVIVAADLGVVALLWRRFGGAALIYAWNPLVLTVFAGGAHYDSLFLLPMVAGWLALERRTGGLLGCGLLGVSVALKYASAPLAVCALLLVLRRDGWRAAALGAGLVALPGALALGVFWGWFGVHALGPTAFGLVARSAELIPRFVGDFWEESLKLNSLFVWPFAAVVLWRLWRSRSLRAFGEEAFLATYVLSPVIHVWYFTWAIPFAVASRNLGLRLVSVSAFVYFLLEYRQAVSAPPWRQTGWEVVAMWTPLLVGFAWSRWRERVARRGDGRCLPGLARSNAT
jgi:hypothetical protein